MNNNALLCYFQLEHWFFPGNLIKWLLFIPEVVMAQLNSIIMIVPFCPQVAYSAAWYLMPTGLTRFYVLTLVKLSWLLRTLLNMYCTIRISTGTPKCWLSTPCKFTLSKAKSSHRINHFSKHEHVNNNIMLVTKTNLRQLL